MKGRKKGGNEQIGANENKQQKRKKLRQWY